MTEDKFKSESALLKHYVEKISSAQSSVQELHAEISQTRQDARIDGFNMEALHQLASAIAKSPHDNGAGLIRDTVKYAQMWGLEVGSVTVDSKNDSWEIPKEPEVATPSPSLFRTKNGVRNYRGETIIQALIGIGVCWMLIELLR